MYDYQKTVNIRSFRGNNYYFRVKSDVSGRNRNRKNKNFKRFVGQVVPYSPVSQFYHGRPPRPPPPPPPYSRHPYQPQPPPPPPPPLPRHLPFTKTKLKPFVHHHSSFKQSHTKVCFILLLSNIIEVHSLEVIRDISIHYIILGKILAFGSSFFH